MTQTHTPGSWSARANGAQWVVDAGRKQRVASVNTALMGQEANARLIAAAPDLLRLCELVNDSFGGGRVMTFSDADIADFAEVIARAKGGDA